MTAFPHSDLLISTAMVYGLGFRALRTALSPTSNYPTCGELPGVWTCILLVIAIVILYLVQGLAQSACASGRGAKGRTWVVLPVPVYGSCSGSSLQPVDPEGLRL